MTIIHNPQFCLRPGLPNPWVIFVSQAMCTSWCNSQDDFLSQYLQQSHTNSSCRNMWQSGWVHIPPCKGVQVNSFNLSLWSQGPQCKFIHAPDLPTYLWYFTQLPPHLDCCTSGSIALRLGKHFVLDPLPFCKALMVSFTHMALTCNWQLYPRQTTLLFGTWTIGTSRMPSMWGRNC